MTNTQDGEIPIANRRCDLRLFVRPAVRPESSSGVSKRPLRDHQRGLKRPLADLSAGAVKAAEPTKESNRIETKERSSMVCDHCGSDAHVTFYPNCPKYCTVCVASGHGRNTNACPNRVCTKCHAIGHNARQCTFCDTCQANHAKNKCPRQQCAYCEEYGHEAKQCPEKPTPTCYACGSDTHQTPRSFDCPEHTCATCQGDLEPKGHNHKYCPQACKLTGHITDVCTFRQCYDVEIDYLNLLLLTKARSTIESYFDATDQASVQPNALRIDGKFSESTDWNHVKQRFAISDRQVLELKSVAHEFKRATTREYERSQREVNHPSNAPIHFVFPESQTDPNGTTRPTEYARDVTKCPVCKTWKFPQEMGRKKWCCKGGNLIDVITPWTQPTDDFRQLCLNTSKLAIEFRFHCRQYNNEVSFASYGINYGKEVDLPKPSFVKISGHIYSRLLNAEDDGTLKYYVHDASYCSPELRLDHIYMLPIDPVVFEWPLAVASASTSAATTPHGTPNKKPKIELRTDF